MGQVVLTSSLTTKPVSGSREALARPRDRSGCEQDLSRDARRGFANDHQPVEGCVSPETVRQEGVDFDAYEGAFDGGASGDHVLEPEVVSPRRGQRLSRERPDDPGHEDRR